MTERLSHFGGCTWFWVWAVVGAGVALSAISLGPILLLPVVVVGLVVAAQPSSRRSAYGLVTGIGGLLLVVAYIQRNGPLNPLPWLAAGLVLFVAGVAAHARRVG